MGTSAALFPSLAPSRNAKVRPWRPTKGCQDGLESIVKHGFHIVLWTWPAGCDGRLQFGAQRSKSRRRDLLCFRRQAPLEV
eukprot:scaffold20569_cov18-Phaeocystis_antarctica.AAC.1